MLFYFENVCWILFIMITVFPVLRSVICLFYLIWPVDTVDWIKFESEILTRNIHTVGCMVHYVFGMHSL